MLLAFRKEEHQRAMLFLFYNDERIKDDIINLYKFELKEFKLSINDSKSSYYGKPMITELTIAKLKIGDLFNKNLTYKIKEVEMR